MPVLLLLRHIFRLRHYDIDADIFFDIAAIFIFSLPLSPPIIIASFRHADASSSLIADFLCRHYIAISLKLYY